MRRRLPPHVDIVRVKGHTYYYFRIGKGPRIRLPDDPESEEFRFEYAMAMAGGRLGEKPKLKKDAPGTLGALIEDYLRTKYRALKSEASKAGYLSRLNRIREDHGHRNVSTMTKERIVRFVLDPLAATPGAALDTLKKLRILIKHARDMNLIKSDPSEGIARPKTGEIRSWTDAEMDIFERRWPIGTKQRTSYAIMLYQGRACVDAHCATWPEVEKGSYVRHKTGVTAYPGVTRELKEALAAWPQTQVTVIPTQWGKPHSVKGFGQFMRDAIEAAGLPLDCQPHGLRKTFGRLLADAGASAHDIMAAMGHLTLAEAERYTREANKRRGGKRAVTLLNDHIANKTPQTASESLGKIAKTKGRSEH